MIAIFTQKLPPQLSSQIQDQYDSLIPILKSYANSNNDKYYAEISRNYDLSCFLLGLAIFYKSVVIPLREGNSAFRDFQSGDIAGIQIGKYTFSNTDRRQIQNMYNDLQEILQKYCIPEYVLLFSDVKEFARNLNTYLKKRHG
jgi:hypothetical protein